MQCDNLCELEPPSEAEKLRNQLSGLHTRLGDFKLATIEKQNSLRAALKESEKRQKEMDDYESRVSKLQQWMTDTKQMTMPGDSAPLTMTMADRSQLHQVSPVLHLLTNFFLFCTCLSKFYMTFKKAVVAAVMVCSTRLEEEVTLTLVCDYFQPLWVSVYCILHFTFTTLTLQTPFDIGIQKPVYQKAPTFKCTGDLNDLDSGTREGEKEMIHFSVMIHINSPFCYFSLMRVNI